MRSDILKSAKTVLLAGITAFLVTLPAFAKTTIPSKPYLYVKDEADVLSTDEEDDLNKMLSEYDKKTSNQIAVLLVETTGSESIEKYSYQVATKWGIGQDDKDNGILITIATDDHKDRIEVGKGLEECVTDARSGHILRSDEVKTAFRNEQWYEGTKSIITQVQNCIGTDGAAIDEAAEAEEKSDRLVVSWVCVLGGILNWFLVMIIPVQVGLGLVGIIATILCGIFAPLPVKFLLLIISIITFVITMIAGAVNGTLNGSIYTGGSFSSGGYGGYGGYDGGGSSGRWSSGGSDFGGGNFGGGGASGQLVGTTVQDTLKLSGTAKNTGSYKGVITYSSSLATS
jgi:uncharacterized protein